MRRDELCGLPQAVFVVRQAGDEDMAYPERYAEVGDVARHRKDVRVVPAGEPAVLLRVDLLQIEDDEAGGLHQPVKIGQISRIVGAEGLTGGVQSRMHALGRASSKNAVRNSIWRSGSPPLTVMPPFLPQ